MRALREHYTAFLRPGRILLTGHSHQAWPDVAEGAMRRAFADAAEHVDDKWGRAMEQADALRAAVARIIGGRAEDVALGQNTHELVARFLSALDLRARPHLVSTDGEFHSLARQLRRLEEAGVEVTRVAADPLETLAERLGAAVREDTAALLCSTVLFGSAAVVPHLQAATRAAQAKGAAVLFDAYHAFMALPFDLADLGPEPVFVVGGGYKYAQWGEGCCWMRVPPGCGMRPVHTGWFSDFAGLEQGPEAGLIGYGSRGADRFAGATYDPVSHYRGAAVARFFVEQGLGVARLREISLRQTARIRAGLPQLECVTPQEDPLRGGFVAFRTPRAGELVARLRAHGVYVDARADILRFGPAPYLLDDEIDEAVSLV